jgi:hypothetical protein
VNDDGKALGRIGRTGLADHDALFGVVAHDGSFSIRWKGRCDVDTSVMGPASGRRGSHAGL